MKKSLLRAAFVACLPFCATGLAVVMTVPAVAAEKAELPKLSKSFSKFVDEAKAANSAKDWQTVIAKCKEAQAAPDLTNYETYLINRFLSVAYFGLNDHANARIALAAVLKNPETPLADRKFLVGPAIGLSAEVNDNAGVIEFGKMAIQDNAATLDNLSTLAVAYYNMNDFPNTLSTTQSGIDAAAKEGKVPPYNLYQVTAFTYDKQKNTQAETKEFLAMARDYGKPDDWKAALDLSLALLPAGGKGSMSGIATLDIYRLRAITEAGWVAQNYNEMAEAASELGSWGDAKWALETGLAKGVLTRAKVGQFLNEVTANAKKDEAGLPTVEKLAGTGKASVSAAEGYYGYGRFADAARAAQKAIGLGGPTLGEAKLLLGMCQVRQGDETSAAQTLTDISGDPSIVRAADLWTAWVTRKKAPPAAPATH